MKCGAIAIAIVHQQVMIVQAARSHGPHEPYRDVHTFTPFGDRLFLASDVPQARISCADVLTIFPPSDVFHMPASGLLELPSKAFSEFVQLSAQHQARHEDLWSAWEGGADKQSRWKSILSV